MNTELTQLLGKFYEGEATLEEEQTIIELLQKDDLPDDLIKEKEMFSFFNEERNELDDNLIKSELLTSPGSFDPFQAGAKSSGFLKYVAALAIFILGYATSWVIQYDSQQKFEQQHEQSLLSLYEGMSGTLNASFSSDRIPLIQNLIEEQLPVAEMLFAHEKDYHVRIAILRQIQAKYPPTETLKIINKAIIKETDPVMLVALVKILMDMDENQANEQMQNLINNNRLDEETETAIKILIS